MIQQDPFEAHKVNLTLPQVGTAVGLALATLVVGGFLCGLAMDSFGSMGAIFLWATGGISGMIARKLLAPNKIVGHALVVSLVLAAVAAEIIWIQRNIVGAEEWAEAISMFPTFLKQYKVDALVAGIFTFFGATSILRQTT